MLLKSALLCSGLHSRSPSAAATAGGAGKHHGAPISRRSEYISLLVNAQPSFATLLPPAECQELAELELLLPASDRSSVPSQLPNEHGLQTSPKQQDREPVHRSTDPGCSAAGALMVDADRSSRSTCTVEGVTKEGDSQQEQPLLPRRRRRRQQQQQQQGVPQTMRKQRHSNSRKVSRLLQQKSAAQTGAAAVAESSTSTGKHQIASKEDNVERWYADVVEAAEHAHKQPPGYQQALQTTIQGWLGPRLEAMGFMERPFPQLQPLSRLSSNSSGTGGAGFATNMESCLAPGAAAVGLAGKQHAVAPSCTTTTFAQWVQSGQDLPVLASQWSQPARWDLREDARLVHESHAAHSYMSNADEHAQMMIGLYEQFAREAAGLPVIAGRKPRSATMPGAASSYTLQAMVPNSQLAMAMEVASSDFLADNYSLALDATYPSSDGSQDHFSQMGSALHSAVLGAAVLTHGDDSGLVLPPALAPVQVVVTAVRKHHCNQSALDSEVERICSTLLAAGLRAEVDGRRCRPARRFADSERRGVPLRIEVRPQDLKARTCTMAQRSTPAAGKLAGISSEPGSLASTVVSLLDEQQSSMQYTAAVSLEANIVDVTSFYELRDVTEAGKWARGPWAGSVEDEAAVMKATGASLRCFPLQQPLSIASGFNTCLYSGYQAAEVAIFARSFGAVESL